MSHLLRGRYEEACRAAYKSVQANPAHSITYMQLVAALAKLGRLDERRAAAARVLELQPAFRNSRQFAGVNCPHRLTKPLVMHCGPLGCQSSFPGDGLPF